VHAVEREHPTVIRARVSPMCRLGPLGGTRLLSAGNRCRRTGRRDPKTQEGGAAGDGAFQRSDRRGRRYIHGDVILRRRHRYTAVTFVEKCCGVLPSRFFKLGAPFDF
jgi:hypothetical protein